MPNVLFRAAVTGVRAQQQAMDVIANNLSNVSTTGYKHVRAEFRDLLYQRLQAGRVGDPNAPTSPAEVGNGSRADVTTRVFSQGSFLESGRILDLAVSGEGYLQVRMPDGQIAYTRDGALQVDAEGHLTTSAGHLIDPPITLPNDLETMSIEPDGRIIGTRVGAEGELTLGQLQLVRFTNQSGLAQLGHNLFLASPNSGEPQVGQPGQNGLGEVVSGFLEGSNVDVGAEMTQMIQAQRAYQLNLKALQTIDEMTGQALQVRR